MDAPRVTHRFSRWQRYARSGTAAQRTRRRLLAVGHPLVVVLAVAGLIAIHQGAHLAYAATHANRSAVHATVLTAADPTGGEPTARVMFEATDGTTHRASVVLGPDVRVGDELPLWVTDSGRVTAAPTHRSPLSRSMVGWLLVALGALLTLVASGLVSQVAARRRDDALFADITRCLRGEAAAWEARYTRL